MQNSTNSRNQYALSEAARMVPCSAGTIHRYAEANMIPYERHGPYRLFTDESVERARAIYGRSR